MSKFIEFLKTTIIGGFLVLLPVVAVLALVGIAVATLINIVTPIVGKLPIKTVGGLALATLLAVFVLLAFCFLAGLFVQMRFGRLVQKWAEDFLLQRLPGYVMFKNLSRQLAGQEGIEFAPALVDLYGSEARVMGLIVEEHADGKFTIFVPISPTATLGQVYFLPHARVERLEARFVDVVNSLTQWGMESKKLFQPPLKGS
ncbi:MAG: DUF502 domain-containing protein [Desulfobaccales bacterium]